VKLLVLSINYAPEPTGFAPHTTALAEHLAKAGHDVEVVTGFPFAPRWRRWDEYQREFIRRETVNGVRLTRITHFVPRRPGSAWQRILMEGSFCLSGAVALLCNAIARRSAPDAILYVGAQPSIAWLARVLSALYGVPYVVKITDLATQAAVDVQVVTSPLVARALERLEFSAYRRAGAAIVLCHPFDTALRRSGFRDAIHLIRDSVDLEAIRPRDGSPFRERHGIGRDEFVVLYSGSLGLKQGLSSVLDAAAQIKALGSDIRWVIVGEGETRISLERQAKDAGLGDRVLLLPLQPEHEVGQMLGAADVLLLSQLRMVKDTVIPSKLLMYMAAGKPVLAAVNAGSQAAAIVRDAQCGIIVEPENPGALADAVQEAQRQPEARRSWASRSRAFAERHFERRAIVEEQQFVIENLVFEGLR
jgi:colanic acid biosynthesis glycosyl transferase WcaI